jgi:hypothetical protein
VILVTELILVTEQLIPNDEVRRSPQSTIIPLLRVHAIVHCPWGAYPSSVPGCYDYDYETLRNYRRFPEHRSASRLTWSGQRRANVIAPCSRRTLIIMKHEKRRFLERVDYIASSGFLSGGTSRADSGLTGGGPDKVITDLAALGFDPESKRMTLVSVHPGETVDQVISATGFDLRRYSLCTKNLTVPSS